MPMLKKTAKKVTFDLEIENVAPLTGLQPIVNIHKEPQLKVKQQKEQRLKIKQSTRYNHVEDPIVEAAKIASSDWILVTRGKHVENKGSRKNVSPDRKSSGNHFSRLTKS